MSFDEVPSFGQKLSHANFMQRGSANTGVDHVSKDGYDLVAFN